MHIFITGAAGFIGRATVPELLAHGHTVLGLARSDITATTLESQGISVHRGDLEDLESLKAGAAKADGVIHLAFDHAFTDFAAASRKDQAAISAIGEAIARTDKFLIIASGTMLTQGKNSGIVATEDTEPERETAVGHRAKSADLVYELSKTSRVRGMVVRFPPTVHGTGDKGMVPNLIKSAQKNGVASVMGDGSARWPAVHVNDTAVLLRLAAEKGRAGATYNAVAEEGVSMGDIMGLAGKRLGVEVKSLDAQEALEKVGFLAFVLGADNPTSSEKTKQQLGWEPTGVGLLEDMEACYFDQA